MSESVRASWEVVAGVLPGTPIPGYTKQFHLTSSAWDGGSDEGIAAFKKAQEAAEEYARSIQHPAYVNWVQSTFLWW